MGITGGRNSALTKSGVPIRHFALPDCGQYRQTNSYFAKARLMSSKRLSLGRIGSKPGTPLGSVKSHEFSLRLFGPAFAGAFADRSITSFRGVIAVYNGAIELVVCGSTLFCKPGRSCWAVAESIVVNKNVKTSADLHVRIGTSC